MTDFEKRLENLSPEKRALIVRKLQEKAREAKREVGRIPVRSNPDDYPLSFAQQRMWFLNQWEPDNPFYNITAGVKVIGSLDKKIFERSINEIINRHEILRSYYTIGEDGYPEQRVLQLSNLEVSEIELHLSSDSDREKELKSTLVVEARRPIDISKPPLLRVLIIRTGIKEAIIVFTIHHIIADGGSIGILVREFSLVYEAFKQGRSSPLPELGIQYADYAEWQQKWLEGEIWNEQLRYWRETFEKLPSPLELPVDHPRPVVQSFNGSVESILIPTETKEAIKSLGNQHNASLFMVLLSAFYVLLYRYCGQNDICVGTPISNRNRTELENLIGLFVNTLALRAKLTGSMSFIELLEKVRETALSAYANQDLPFEILVDELGLQRDLSRTPLYQVMFALQDAALEKIKLTSLELNQVNIETGTAKFDLTFFVEENPHGLKAMMEYNTDLFDADTIKRLLNSFNILLEDVIDSPDLHIDFLPVLDEIDHHRIVSIWNDTKREYPDSKNVAQLFESQVEKSPDRIAVIQDDVKLTYRELNKRANQLAHFLQNAGVRQEKLVGIFMERSIDMIVATLGIVKAGGAYMPLDPDFPKNRLDFMINDGEINIVISTSDLSSYLPSSVEKIIDIDLDWSIIDKEPTTNLPNTTYSDNLLYVMYTSGSTGVPKGVSVTHRGVMRLVINSNFARLSSEDIFLQLAPITFDAATLEIWGPLLNGGQLAIAPPSRLTMGDIGRLIEDYGVTILWLTASLFHLMVDSEIDKLGSLEQLLAGGDVLSVSHVSKLKQVHPNLRLTNGYGPTENTTFSTTYDIKNVHDFESSVPIGHPISNSTVYILDNWFNPVPVGVTGELFVGGDGLARNYMNRPDLTAERFIPNPLSGIPGDRMYKTGDLSRFREDGVIEFFGRKDFQVKIRGFRIELGEIETVVGQYAGIQNNVVMVYKDGTGNKILISYLVLKPGFQLDKEDLRNYLKDRLPEYMVPSIFMILDQLPITPNGKVDRNALPMPDWIRPDIETVYEPPTTPIEIYLAKKWQQVLGIQRIGIYDNFFEIGGDSLRAAVLINRLQDVFGEQARVKVVFLAPTIAEMAEYLNEHYPDIVAELIGSELESTKTNVIDRFDRGIQNIKPISRDGELPLSYAQQRLWFLDQWEPESPYYNVPSGVRLKGSINIDALRQSINQVVERHEVLRTRYLSDAGKAKLVIEEQLRIPLPVIDLSKLQEENQYNEALRLARREARKPFNLAVDAMLRTFLIKLGENDHILVLTMHHIASDGWSIGVLIREVTTLYNAYVSHTPPEIKDLPIQYLDYAAWQREWLEGDLEQEQLNYWKRKLADSPKMLELPTDRPRPPVQSQHGAQQYFDLPDEISIAIRKLSNQLGKTLFTTLLSAFQILLYRYTGQTDICIGTPVANRTREEVENLIGFFVNTLVLRGDLSGDPIFLELIEATQETSLEAFEHQDVPFEHIVDELQLEREMSHTPLFQVMFTIQDAPFRAIPLPGLLIEPLEIDSGTAKFDLILTIVDRGDSLRGVMEYNTDLFDPQTIDRFVAHFNQLLGSIVENPEGSISEINILPPTERDQLINLWSMGPTVEKAFIEESVWNQETRQKTLYEIFEQQVSANGDRLAVVYVDPEYGESSLSFNELNQAANKLAHYLLHLGVMADELIGLLVDRSVDQLVGILGIWKAGAAYLPLDPSYPEERLSFILDDARVKVLLTQKALESVGDPNGREGTRAHDSIDEQIKIIYMDSDWEDLFTGLPDSNPKIAGNNQSLAYVIYTSGSTGKPKGVMIEHKMAVNLMLGLREAIYERLPSEGLRISLNAPLPFDASVQQLVMLLAGHTLHIVPQSARQDGRALLEYINASRIELLDCVPSQLKLLVDAGLLENDHWRPSAILPGGEAIDQQLWDKLASTDAIDFYNMYGPTECTVDSTICWINKKVDQPSIGRPITQGRVYVLDEHYQPVPIGIPGELYIGGSGVGRGYLHRPELTADRFVPDPFMLDKPGQRMYRTGDLVRFLPDGNLAFLGRLDYQVKVRGFRIELGDIEASLLGYPAIKETVVVVREDRPGEKQIVAYLVKNVGVKSDLAESADTGLTVGELRSYLGQKLPSYMIPSYYVTLDALPLTPNGKVDRSALPEPEGIRPDLGMEMVAPRTPIEASLAVIWSDVLGLDTVGVHDNFFDLGGDSILSIQIIARANQVGVHLTPRDMFEAQTIAALALKAGGARKIHAEQGPVIGSAPLTPIQQHFFEQDYQNPDHWNQALVLELSPDNTGQANERESRRRPIIEGALQVLIKHHDALRLRIIENNDGDGMLQYFADQDEQVPFEWVNLTEVKLSDRFARMEQIASEWQSSLDIKKGPILQVIYFDIGPDNPARLLFIIHHLAIDGVSWRILLEDFQSAYTSIEKGTEVMLPQKTTSYKAWAETLNTYAKTEEMKRELAYWNDVVSNELNPLPVDFASGENMEVSTGRVRRVLDKAQTESLSQAVTQIFDAEISDALLMVFGLTLKNWTRQPTIIVHMEGHGREAVPSGLVIDDEDLGEIDVSRTVGWFTSLFPVRITIDDENDFRHSLSSIRSRMRGIPGRGIGYGILKYLSPYSDRLMVEEDSSLELLSPQISFNYLGRVEQRPIKTSHGSATGLEGMRFSGISDDYIGSPRGPENKREHLIDFISSIVDGELRMEWIYSTAIHKETSIQELAETYLSYLIEFIDNALALDFVPGAIPEFQDMDLDKDEFDALLDELGGG